MFSFPFFGEETAPVRAGQGGAQNYVAPGDKTGEILLWNMRARAAASNFSKDIPRVLNGRGCQQLVGEKMKSILCLKPYSGGGGKQRRTFQYLLTTRMVSLKSG